MLYKFSALRRRQTQVHGFNEMLVVLEVAAEDLSYKLVGLQASLGSNLSQLRFFVGL